MIYPMATIEEDVDELNMEKTESSKLKMVLTIEVNNNNSEVCHISHKCNTFDDK